MIKRIPEPQPEPEPNNPFLEDASAYDAMLAAAKHGIIEFIRSMRKAKPHLLSATDKSNNSIITYAIANRQLDLLHEMHQLPKKQLQMISRRVDKFGNNMLHLAAESRAPLPLEHRSCAALQMRRELHLFKKLEKMADPTCKEAKNVYGEKPRDVFDKAHKELVKAGEKWVKSSANSFILVGTLIVTIMFAAVFTAPGGYNQETGVPILLSRNWFKVFIVADAISLFLSTTSMLIFVWIISSRYNETDLLASLPFKLVAGQFILFLSIVSMVVAFGAAHVLMLRGEWSIVTTAMGFACIPIIVFFTTQLPLFIDAFRQ